ncbi:MAG: transaldolase [Gemmatimonadaceae bacterium]|nr:transaldolase [Gemmatimonadaceae bacterium]
MNTPLLDNLKVRIFADGADVDGMVKMAKLPLIKGFTTNPTLMRKAGISDYRSFAREVLRQINDRPISFEVFSDDFEEMEDQALEIASWGPNVNVKIPVTNSDGESTAALISTLSSKGVHLNVTALMTLEQVDVVLAALRGSAPAFISVFAGRIADTGRDPMPIMAEAARRVAVRPGTEIIWASPRELLNIFQADDAGVQVITVANDLLKKLEVVGKSLIDYSLETVRMFRDDAVKAGYEITGSRA